MARALKKILQKELVIPPDKMQPYKKNVVQFMNGAKNVSKSAKRAVKRLRALADRNDEAWWEYKLRHAIAVFACVVGGLISYWKGRTVTTGVAIVTAGAVVALQLTHAQNAQNLKDYKRAENLLKETEEKFTALKKMIHDWSVEKDADRLIHIYQHAEYYGVATPQVLTIIVGSILDTIEKPWFRAVPLLDNLHHLGIIPEPPRNYEALFNSAFLVLDAMELGFNIMDLWKNKGTDFAKDLRQIAEDIEDGFTE